MLDYREFPEFIPLVEWLNKHNPTPYRKDSIPLRSISEDKYTWGEEGVNAFNEAWKFVRDNPAFREANVTESGRSISKLHRRPFTFVFSIGNAHAKLTIVCPWGMKRVYIGPETKTKAGHEITGTMAFNKFVQVCEKHGVNLEDFAVDNGMDYKQQMEKPLIKVANHSFYNKIFENAHHIDLNSSYMSGIAKAYPALYAPIKDIYDNRKTAEDPELYKAILTHAYGYFQSQYIDYRFANLSKAALDYNNQYIRDLTEKLKNANNAVIAYNTDGIWYTGDLYSDENEGPDLGQWKNDHTNCKIRFKSNGAYEYIENGKYHPVLRGECKYDKICPRNKWTWGSIYREDASPINYIWTKDGFVKEERNEAL